MRQRDEHREVSSGRASEAATGRLRGSLRREVGDLEVRLEEAHLRSNAFLDAGLDAEAAKVLDESRVMVDQFHRRLESALAEASVEREAERILAGSQDVVDVLGDSPAGGIFRRVPAGIGAAVASLAVFAMAIVTLRAPQERDLRPAGDVSALPSPEDSDDRLARELDDLGRLSPSLQRAVRLLSAAELEVLSEVPQPDTVVPLLERRRRLLDRLAAGAQPISATVLAELDKLVAQLRTEGVDVDRLIRLERVEGYWAQERARQEPPAQEPQPEQAPAEQPPANEPAPADEPAPDESEGEEEGDGVIPFDNGGDDPDDSEDRSGAGASGQDNDSKDDDGTGILDN